MKFSGGPLENQTWQTEWKTVPLAKGQLFEYKNQTLEALLRPAVCLPSLIVPPEFLTLRRCLHGRRVTLLEGAPS